MPNVSTQQHAQKEPRRRFPDRAARRLVTFLAGLLRSAEAPPAPRDRRLELRDLGLVPGESAPINYYRLVEGADGEWSHAESRPGMEAMKRGWEVPEAERRTWRTLEWRWRATVLPQDGDECFPERGDSAASIYVGWRRGLRWYAVKYSWSSVGHRGAVCARQRNPLLASDTLIQETGGPLGEWKAEHIDLDTEFRNHFAGGDPHADVPDFIGIPILTDGDQTHTEAAADFADFALRAAP